MKSSSKNDRVVKLGVITKAHGVRGELRVRLFNPDSEWLQKQRSIYLERGDVRESRTVAAVRRADQEWLVTLDGIADRTQAEALRGAYVSIPRSELPALESGEFYLTDVEGSTVECEGRLVGIVDKVVEYPTVVCAVVRSEDGTREVPLVEPYLVSFDGDEQRLRVEHFFDLDLQAP